MFVITVIASILLAQIIAYKNDSKLADTLGMTCCGLILVLYILAFFGSLSWVDYISIAVIVFALVWIVHNYVFVDIIKGLFSIQNIVIIAFLFLLTVSQIDRIATWLGDVNYWATDAKTLWMMDGFAAKYGNVTPENGYCPPAVQLFKWLFLHMNRQNYVEGLGYAGYICFNFLLLLPLISRLDSWISTKDKIVDEEDDNVGVEVVKNKNYYVSNKKLVSKYKVRVAGNNSEILGYKINLVGCVVQLAINIVACVCLILLPTIASTLCFEGSCGDITAGIIYGMLLLAMWDKDRDHVNLYFARIAVYGCVLVLSASSGVKWAIFAIVFMIASLCYDRRKEKFNRASLYENNIRLGFFSILSWGIALLSWLIFCLIKHRAVDIANINLDMDTVGNGGLLYYKDVKLPLLLKAMVIYPAHADKTWRIGLSVVAIIILFIVAIIVMEKRNIINSRYKMLLLVYIIATATVTYMSIGYRHLTVLTTDMQYTTAQDMAGYISYYGAPFVIGTLVFLIGMYIRSVYIIDDGRPVIAWDVWNQVVSDNVKRVRMTYIVVAVLILVCSNFKACYKGLLGYRETLSENTHAMVDMIDDEESQFVELVADNQEFWGKRVLYLKDAGNVRWDHNPYINYEVAPVAVVYGTISSDIGKEELNKLIVASQAKYLYVEDIEGVDERLGLVLEWAHVDEQGQVNMYRILGEGRIEPYRATIEQ